MLDTFAIYAPGGRTVVNGMEVEGYTSHGTTPGKVQGEPRDTQILMQTVGGVSRPVIQGGVHVPASSLPPVAGDIGIGWEYQLTTLGPYTDPGLLNSRWLVIDAPAKSFATARRLDVVRLDR